MSEQAPAIRIRGLVKTFDEGLIRALNGVDMEVLQGEFAAIVGPSGCGKSTLLHLIAALDRPDEGTIEVLGHELRTERSLDHYRARDVGLVFQLDNLIMTLSAAENVQVPMFESHLGAGERRTRAEELLALVGLTGRDKNRPAQLSGGERQRVAIARALANDPPILLADEPTGRLDSVSGKRVLELIEELRIERGLTVVLVTHESNVAERADRVIRMLDGRVVEAGTTAGTEAEAAAGQEK
ncbi:MAG TPA: ABC transporter ATP-binding protein [Dehalococcoidia bacterium]|nr:ABC transporter ATP-binding protein [Dehalococcoidia bacterium]